MVTVVMVAAGTVVRLHGLWGFPTLTAAFTWGSPGGPRNTT
jgi:hypothetical protein